MWIERIEIEGFRALAGDFEFSQGLNLVFGDNEAGKSTLHDSLIRSLYGFTASERRRSRGRSVRDDCRPWDGRPLRLVAKVRDANGHDYRIEWDFELHSVRLLEGAIDHSAEVQLRGDDVALGELLLGIGIGDFRQVCCLDQESLEAVKRSPSLGVALQEAVAQIGGDVAAQEVIDRLEGFLRERIGVRVDTLAPTARGRITALVAERGEVMAALEAERLIREQIAGLAGDLERNRDEYREMTAKIERTRQRLLLTERDELARKLDEARRLEARASKRAEVPPMPPARVVDRIHAAHIRLEQLAVTIAASELEVARVASEVEPLERKERELDAKLLQLGSYADVDDSARDSVQRTWGELDGFDRRALSLPEPPPEFDPLLVRYRSERSALYALQAGAASWTARRIAWTVLVVLTLGAALLVRAVIRRWRGTAAATGELERRLAEYSASSLAQLDERAGEEDRRLAAAQAHLDLAQSQASDRQEQEAELERTLVDMLDAARAVPAETVEARAKAYLEACKLRAEHETAALESARMKNDLQRLRGSSKELKDQQSERDNLVRELTDLYRQADVDDEDLSAAEKELEALLGQGASALQANQEAAAAAQALDTLLGESILPEFEAHVADAGRALAEHAALGTLASTVGDKSALQRELAELQREAEDTRDRVTEAQTRTSGLEEQIGGSAELEERRVELDVKIERLEQAKEAIRIAREVLRDAAGELNRQFQPHLRDALTRNLPRITGDRYRDVEIDDELRVYVVIPGVGRQVSVDQLSRATKDQVFLVERLEIARLLAPVKGAAPLLLDDPFAHYDAKRLHFCLQLLHEAAQERQVVIFSEDVDLPALARAVCGDCNVIDLPEATAHAVGVGDPPKA